MRTSIVILSALWLATGAGAREVHDFSQPPPPKLTDISVFTHKVIACRDPEDIKAIFAAGKAAQGMFDREFDALVSQHECLPRYVIVRNVTTGESIDLGESVIDGVSGHFYIEHVGNMSGELYFLYEQGDVPDLDLSPGTDI